MGIKSLAQGGSCAYKFGNMLEKTQRASFSPLFQGGKTAHRSREQVIGTESNKWDSKKGDKMATRESTNPKVDQKIYHNTAATTKAINLAGKKRYRGGIRL